MLALSASREINTRLPKHPALLFQPKNRKEFLLVELLLIVFGTYKKKPKKSFKIDTSDLGKSGEMRFLESNVLSF